MKIFQKQNPSSVICPRKLQYDLNLRTKYLKSVLKFLVGIKINVNVPRVIIKMK